MIEDRLTRGERIRLESIAQANLRLSSHPVLGSYHGKDPAALLLETAAQIASYIAPDPADMARDAYNAYSESAKYKSFSGDTLQYWEHLPPAIQDHWVAATRAILSMEHR